MPFIETQFPPDIARGATGGPGFKTDVVVVDSGAEQRNALWQDARCSFDVSHGIKTREQLARLVSFFRVMQGRKNGFRFKDWGDYQVATGAGLFTALTGTTFQMIKRYTEFGSNHDRIIRKPVSGTVLVTGGSGVSVDYTTGIVTVTSGTPTSWTGEFDVPARFDTDQMRTTLDNRTHATWGQIPIVEIRV